MGTRSARTPRIRRPETLTEDWQYLLTQRVIAVEERLTLLEARLMRTAKALKAAGAPKEPLSVLAHKDFPRCPGCLIEHSEGEPTDKCMWCGFYFEDAVHFTPEVRKRLNLVEPKALATKRPTVKGKRPVTPKPKGRSSRSVR